MRLTDKYISIGFRLLSEVLSINKDIPQLNIGDIARFRLLSEVLSINNISVILLVLKAGKSFRLLSEVLSINEQGAKAYSI